MSGKSFALPVRRFGLEAIKKIVLCMGAAVAVGTALPYSLDFAFQAVTYLAFTVALSEGGLSVYGEVVGDLHYAFKKVLEGVETLAASLFMMTLQLVGPAFS